MKINILMIDDHPSQIEGYKAILGFNQDRYETDVVVAYSCKSAYEIITNPYNAGKFQLVFLDLSLPAYHEKSIYSGEDLALLIRETWPDTKIMMLTSHSEAIVLYNITRKTNPEGLLVKSDFTGDGLLSAFDKVLKGEKYYTETVRSGLKELLSRELYLDNTNREIIMLLAKGVKTKNMMETLNVSRSSIDKRKQFIKDYLCVENGTDDDIVIEAKRLGLI